MVSRISAGALFCSVLFTSCTNTQEPLLATVCEIVATPERFSGQTVTISATWAVSYHFTLLKDENCPDVGIALLISDEAETHDDIRAFTDLAYGKSGTAADRPRRRASFTGQFQIQKGPGEIPYRVLDLRSFVGEN